MTRALARFFALPRAEQGRVLEAALLLLIVRLALGCLPFRWTLRVFGCAPERDAGGRIMASEAQDVSRAIARAARHVPFRAVCLQQAFAAFLMLRRRGLAATVHLGVARNTPGGELTAHAWSRCGDLPVTGAAAASAFASVAAFAA